MRVRGVQRSGYLLEDRERRVRVIPHVVDQLPEESGPLTNRIEM